MLLRKYAIVILANILSYAQLTNTCSKPSIERLEKGCNMFKVNRKDTRTSSVTLRMTPECRFIVNFEYILHLFLVFLCLILSK